MRLSYFIAAGIAIAAGAWIYSGQFESGMPDAKLSDKVAPAPPEIVKAKPELFKVRVRTQKAEDRVNHVVVLGRTEESRRVQLSAETAGRIVAIGARKGDRVRRGEVIARLAMNDRQAWLDMAESRVKQREIEYKAALELSQRNFRSKTGLAATEAELTAAKAEVAARKLDISRTQIKAPFDGVLESRQVEVGDFVKVEGPVATIVDLNPIIVVGHVTETDVGRLEIGTPATAKLVTGQEVMGKIRFIGAVADPVSRTFRVEIEADNKNGALVAGLTAELRLPQDTVHAHRVSPAVLTLDDQGRVGIKSVNADNRVAFHPVSLVADGPEGMWLGGLPETITLITVGQEFVNVGQKVIPIHEEALTARREGETIR